MFVTKIYITLMCVIHELTTKFVSSDKPSLCKGDSDWQWHSVIVGDFSVFQCLKEGFVFIFYIFAKIEPKFKFSTCRDVMLLSAVVIEVKQICLSLKKRWKHLCISCFDVTFLTWWCEALSCWWSHGSLQASVIEKKLQGAIYSATLSPCRRRLIISSVIFFPLIFHDEVFDYLHYNMVLHSGGLVWHIQGQQMDQLFSAWSVSHPPKTKKWL